MSEVVSKTPLAKKGGVGGGVGWNSDCGFLYQFGETGSLRTIKARATEHRHAAHAIRTTA